MSGQRVARRCQEAHELASPCRPRAQEVPTLIDLAFDDVYYGAAPIVEQPSYTASALQSLHQVRSTPATWRDGKRCWGAAG